MYTISVAAFPIMLIYIRKLQIQIRKFRKLRKSLQAMQADNGSNSTQEQRDQLTQQVAFSKKNILEYFCNLLGWFIIVVCIESGVSLSISAFAFAGGILQRFAWIKFVKQETISYSKKGILIWKILLIILIINVLLKVDGIFNMKWEATIWPVYIICSLALVCSVSSTLICAGTICGSMLSSNDSYAAREQQEKESKLCLNIWVFYIINGFTSALVITVFQVIRQFNNSLTMNEYKFFLYPSIYLGGVLLFTSINFKTLQRWLVNNVLNPQKENTQNEEDIEQRMQNRLRRTHRYRRYRNQQMLAQLQLATQHQKEKVETEDTDSLESTPRFLMLVSGCYFKTLKDSSQILMNNLQRFSQSGSTTQQVPIKQEIEKAFNLDKITNKQEKKTQKDLDKKLEELLNKAKQNISKLERESIVIDDKICFTDQNEAKDDINTEQFQKSKRLDQDQSTHDPFMLETKPHNKQEFINALKSPGDRAYIQKNLTIQNLASQSLSKQKKAFTEDKQQQQNSITSKNEQQIYKEFLNDPEKFKSQFKCRLSQREVDRHDIKQKVLVARKELRSQFNNQIYNDYEKMQALKKDCLICLERRADAVIMNCGHGGICFDCGCKLSERKQDQRCHLCRKKIRKILKIDIEKVSGSFIPIVQYLDLRCAVPEIRQIKKKVIELDEIQMSINEEILSEDNEINVNVLDVHEQKKVFMNEGEEIIPSERSQQSNKMSYFNS